MDIPKSNVLAEDTAFYCVCAVLNERFWNTLRRTAPGAVSGRRTAPCSIGFLGFCLVSGG